MFQILDSLDDVLCQMDNVLMYTDTQFQHDRQLLAVLKKLQEAGVILGSEKNWIKFLR